MTPRPLPRRDLLAWLGAGAVAVFGVACGGDSNGTNKAAPGSTSTAPPSTTSAVASATTTARGTATPASCVLAPEQTEGPYYIASAPERRDVTEGRPGVPLRLDLAVVNPANCAPIPGAKVEIWHADAGGEYSGFGGGAGSRTFMRGAQTAGADGKAIFNTVYPGWYQGRAVHIHVKVHVGGLEVHTGQLYFDDNVSQTVYERAPYNTRSGQWLRNPSDGIYGAGSTQSTLALSPEGNGYVGTINLGVRR